MVAQETIHSLSKKKDANEVFILKVDLEKAYDRVKWSFLREVLMLSGSNRPFSDLIVHYISSNSLALCWNGKTLHILLPTRGLCQGDPLSPYLFVLCMEVMGHSLKNAVDSNVWRLVRVARNSLGISHIFFVNDLLLL